MLEKELDYKLNINSLKNFLGLGIPFWMDSRKSMFTFFLFDFFCVYLILLNKESYINDKGLFFLTFFWSISSYISGRYSYYERLKSKLEKIYNLLTSTILVVTVIYIFQKFALVFFSDFISLGKNNTILLFISSSFMEVIKTYLFLENTANITFLKIKLF